VPITIKSACGLDSLQSSQLANTITTNSSCSNLHVYASVDNLKINIVMSILASKLYFPRLPCRLAHIVYDDNNQQNILWFCGLNKQLLLEDISSLSNL